MAIKVLKPEKPKKPKPHKKSKPCDACNSRGLVKVWDSSSPYPGYELATCGKCLGTQTVTPERLNEIAQAVYAEEMRWYEIRMKRYRILRKTTLTLEQLDAIDAYGRSEIRKLLK